MTTATLYTIEEVNFQAAIAVRFGGTIERFTAVAKPSEESISEGCDAVDRQSLIVVTPADSLPLVYFRVGTAGWAVEPLASTAQEFCELEYSGDEWSSYVLTQVDSF